MVIANQVINFSRCLDLVHQDSPAVIDGLCCLSLSMWSLMTIVWKFSPTKLVVPHITCNTFLMYVVCWSNCLKSLCEVLQNLAVWYDRFSVETAAMCRVLAAHLQYFLSRLLRCFSHLQSFFLSVIWLLVASCSPMQPSPQLILSLGILSMAYLASGQSVIGPLISGQRRYPTSKFQGTQENAKAERIGML